MLTMSYESASVVGTTRQDDVSAAVCVSPVTHADARCVRNIHAYRAASRALSSDAPRPPFGRIPSRLELRHTRFSISCSGCTRPIIGIGWPQSNGGECNGMARLARPCVRLDMDVHIEVLLSAAGLLAQGAHLLRKNLAIGLALISFSSCVSRASDASSLSAMRLARSL